METLRAFLLLETHKVSDKKNKVGRPSEYTQRTADIICDRLADGESLRSICSTAGMPNRVTVFRWLSQNEEFRIQYARAREAQADTIADEILNIADENTNDTTIDKDGNEVTNHDVIARARLKIDTRKWLAGKLRPKVYGDKLQQEHTGADGGPMTIQFIKEIVDSN